MFSQSLDQGGLILVWLLECNSSSSSSATLTPVLQLFDLLPVYQISQRINVLEHSNIKACSFCITFQLRNLTVPETRMPSWVKSKHSKRSIGAVAVFHFLKPLVPFNRACVSCFYVEFLHFHVFGISHQTWRAFREQTLSVRHDFSTFAQEKRILPNGACMYVSRTPGVSKEQTPHPRSGSRSLARGTRHQIFHTPQGYSSSQKFDPRGWFWDMMRTKRTDSTGQIDA